MNNRVSHFIKENVKVKVQLWDDLEPWLDVIRREQHIRRLELVEGQDINPEERTVGFHVGMDYLTSPKTTAGFPQCTAAKDQSLSLCHRRAVHYLKLGNLNLLYYYVEFFTDGKAPEQEFSGFCNHQKFLDETTRMVSSTLKCAFMLGKSDGIEDGASTLRTILGKEPGLALWYQYHKYHESRPSSTGIPLGQLTQESSTGCTQDSFIEVDPPKYRAPIEVQAPNSRREKYSMAKEMSTKPLEKVEKLFSQLLELQIESYLLKNSKNPDLHQARFKHVDRRLQDVHDNMMFEMRYALTYCYQIGKVCGFEYGQDVVKDMYNVGNKHNNQYYEFTEDQGRWVVIDTSQSCGCTCQQCCQCIREMGEETFMASTYAKMIDKQRQLRFQGRYVPGHQYRES